MRVVVGGRGSNLSIKQIEEVLEALRSWVPEIEFEPVLSATTGDRDLKASLHSMEKTNFFTKEIDQMQLEGRCRIAIHSAKDLPDPLPKGLKLVALTRGKDSSDVLVMREGEGIETLKKGGRVGSSSARRDRAIGRLRPDLHCVEVRGTVEERLKGVFSGEIEALAVAKAALIRLGLTHLNSIPLRGETPPMQGKLAVIAREGDVEMERLFFPLDTEKREKILYVGLNPSEGVVHLPLIEVVPRSFDRLEIAAAFRDMSKYTHIIFTSQSGVECFFECLKYHGYKKVEGKEILAVGKATAQKLKEGGVESPLVATEETQEGIIDLLAGEDLDRAYVLLPQSSRARPILSRALLLRGARLCVCPLYDTRVKVPPTVPDLETFNEIIFTSPSTVEAFIEIFGPLPRDKRLTSIGPVTENKLKFFLE